jgi:hypothetical protein
MTNRKTILVLIMAILSLSAGMVVGWVWTPLAKVEAAAPGIRPAPRPWFEQLDLSTDQKAQMDKIWSDTRAQMQKMFQQRHDMDHQREQEIIALLNPQQIAAYEKINQQFNQQREDTDKQRDALLADANARSRALLDDSQKEKWDILAKDMRRRHGPWGLSTQRSTTMPSMQGEEHHD